MKNKTIFFEIINKPETEAEETFHTTPADDSEQEIWFTPLQLTAEEEASVRHEIYEWELVDNYYSRYEDLAYNDVSESAGERVITEELFVTFLNGSHLSNQVRGGYLLKDGKFAGFLLAIENTSSFGMAVNKANHFSALLTDGTKSGETAFHFFHSSTETSSTEQSKYELRRRNPSIYSRD